MNASNEWALVLGCSRGSGAAIARQVALDPGLNIFGVHRGNNPELCAAVKNDIEHAGRVFHQRVGQGGDHSSAVAGAKELLRVAGTKSVRLFVHSIADASYGLFASGDERQLHPKQFVKTFDRMAHSFVYWTQELLANDLLADGATLVGLTNSLVQSAVNGWGLNSAAKMTLESYIHHLGNELGPRGYRVMLLKFSLAETRAIKMAFTPEVWEGVKKRAIRATPSRRMVTLEEVARFVSFLTNDLALWFNATTIDFTGAQLRDLPDLMINKELYEKEEGKK